MYLVKPRIVFFIIGFTLLSTAASAQVSVDTNSEWNNGVFSQTEARQGELALKREDVVVDWQKDNTTYPYRLRDAEAGPGDAEIYVAANSINLFTVARYNESGTLNWSIDEGSYEVTDIEVDDDFVYTASDDETIKKIYKENGNIADSFPIPGSNDVRDLSIDDNYIYLVDDGNNVKKLDKSTGAEQWSEPVSNTPLAVTSHPSGDVYVGNYVGIERFDGGTGNPSGSLSVDRMTTVESGPNGNIYAGTFNDEEVLKLDQDLNSQPGWPVSFDTGSGNQRPGDIDFSPSGYVYISTQREDDATYKYDSAGNQIWRRQDPESQFGVEHTSDAVYSAGKYNNQNGGDGDGVLTRFIETMYSSGDYESTSFGTGSDRWWGSVNVTTARNGQSGEVTAIIDDSSSLNSPTATRTTNLVDGKAVMNFNGQKADYMGFNISLSGSGIETPEVDMVEAHYFTTAPNSPPTASNGRPDSKVLDPGTHSLNLTVSDPDGDTVTVDFYVEGSYVGSDTVSSGSMADITHDFPDYGRRYDWSVQLSDGNGGTNSYSYYFDTSVDDPAQISDPNPGNNSVISPGTVSVSARIEDPENQETNVEIYNQTGHLKNADFLPAGGPDRVSANIDAPNYGTLYKWTVVAYNGSNVAQETYWFTTSSNPQPQVDSYSPTDGTTFPKSTNSQTLTVDVSDPNGDNMNVWFFDDSGNQIGSAQPVSGPSGSASMTYSGLSPGNRYDWSVEVTDGNSNTSESHHFFTAADQLPVINNPSPTNGTALMPGTHTVSANVSDLDGDDTVVEIYNETGHYIGGANLNSGGPQTVSATYQANQFNHKYEWYVVAYRDGNPSKKTEKAYYFTTDPNPPPQILDYYPPNGTNMKPGSFDMNVTVEDPNGDDITVKFRDNDSDQINGNKNINGGGPATVEVQHVAAGNGKSFYWYVNLSDGTTTVNRIFRYQTFVDNPPSISNAWPKNDKVINFHPANLSGFVTDDFSSTIDVEFRDDAGNTITTKTVADSSFANTSYMSLSSSGYYNWTIVASDGTQSSSKEYRFYYKRPKFVPVNVNIDNNYSTIIASDEGSKIVRFKINNPSNTKNLRASIQGTANARFLDGSTQKDFTMGTGTRSFEIEIAPTSTGEKTLVIDIENRDYGIITSDRQTVSVRSIPDTYQERGIPGIGGLQIILLALMSTAVYFVSL